MSREPGVVDSASVEARWVDTPWWQEVLTSAALALIAGPITAVWLRRNFPGAPLVSLAGLIVFWLIAAYGLYQRARGLVGRYRCPSCGAAIGFSGGFSPRGKPVPRTECARCGVHLAYPGDRQQAKGHS